MTWQLWCVIKAGGTDGRQQLQLSTCICQISDALPAARLADSAMVALTESRDRGTSRCSPVKYH